MFFEWWALSGLRQLVGGSYLLFPIHFALSLAPMGDFHSLPLLSGQNFPEEHYDDG